MSLCHTFPQGIPSAPLILGKGYDKQQWSAFYICSGEINVHPLFLIPFLILTEFGLPSQILTELCVQPQILIELGVQPQILTEFGVQPKILTELGV